MSIPFCPKCGTMLSPGVTPCPRCGATIAAPTESDDVTPQEFWALARTVLVPIIGLVVLFIILIIVIVVALA